MHAYFHSSIAALDPMFRRSAGSGRLLSPIKTAAYLLFKLISGLSFCALFYHSTLDRDTHFYQFYRFLTSSNVRPTILSSLSIEYILALLAMFSVIQLDKSKLTIFTDSASYLSKLWVLAILVHGLPLYF